MVEALALVGEQTNCQYGQVWEDVPSVETTQQLQFVRFIDEIDKDTGCRLIYNDIVTVWRTPFTNDVRPFYVIGESALSRREACLTDRGVNYEVVNPYQLLFTSDKEIDGAVDIDRLKEIAKNGFNAEDAVENYVHLANNGVFINSSSVIELLRVVSPRAELMAEVVTSSIDAYGGVAAREDISLGMRQIVRKEYQTVLHAALPMFYIATNREDNRH